MLTTLQYEVLKRIARPLDDGRAGMATPVRSRIVKLLGNNLLNLVRNKTVVDFGCGEGQDAIELAVNGARRVFGLDIREEILGIARKNAAEAGVADRCEFDSIPPARIDVIVSVDAFEHFADPASILRTMADMLQPGGEVLVSFGPTWFHPRGGHLFSVFPWAHLVFSEKALIRWRSDFKSDGAKRFSEVAGGLNQMTIKKFEALVRESPFVCESLEAVPIRALTAIHNSLTQEFTSAVVRCRLRKRGLS